MPTAQGIGLKYMPRLQDDAVLSQNNPVSATWYPVLAVTEDVYIYTAVVKATWTVQPTPIEIKLTIDGIDVIHQFTNPVSNTSYGLVHNVAYGFLVQATQQLGDVYTAGGPPDTKEGQSIAVAVRITGGTVSNISSRVKYSRLLPT